MITQWKVFNFKSVRKETDLSIAPLTIFAGAIAGRHFACPYVQWWLLRINQFRRQRDP